MLIAFKAACDSVVIGTTNPYTGKFILKRSIYASMKDKKNKIGTEEKKQERP